MPSVPRSSPTLRLGMEMVGPRIGLIPLSNSMVTVAHSMKEELFVTMTSVNNDFRRGLVGQWKNFKTKGCR